MISQHYLKQLKKFLPFAILLLAFFLQMQYLTELRDMFLGGFSQPFCGIDAEAHVNRAESLLDGTMLAHGVNSHFYFIPMYPFFLAVLKIFGENSILFPIFLQALLQLLGIAALYGIGRMAFSSLTGLLAALGMATYSYYIYYLPCFDQSLLTVPFFTLTIFLILKYRHTNKPGWLLAGGIALAGAILSRPTFLLILPIILIWLYVTNPQSDSSHGWRGMIRISRKRLKIFGKQILLLALPLIVVVLPITWHNYQSTGRFILISSNFDVNLFTGNNPDATGLDTLAHAQGQPAEIRFREAIQRSNNEGTSLTAETIYYVTHQSGDWLALTTTKVWLWFGETDERLVTPVFPIRVAQSQTLASLPLEWQALVITAFLGLILVRGRSPSQTIFLWLIYGIFSAATIFFFIQLRFRLPLMPFMLLLAASLLASARLWRQQRVQRFWIILITFLILYPFVPSLWIFIVLFVGLGLLPDIWSDRKARSLIILLSLAIYLLLIGWWVKADTLASDVSQDIDHYLGPPLAGQSILGQSFKMDCDGLHHIEVTLGTFNDPHDQPVNFYLATDLSGQEIIYSESFAGSSVEDYQKKTFFFDPVSNSAEQTYFFFLSSPTATPKNAITARGYTDTPIDRYPSGRAFAGKLDSLQKIEADFAFGAFCQMSWQEKLVRGINEIWGE